MGRFCHITSGRDSRSTPRNFSFRLALLDVGVFLFLLASTPLLCTAQTSRLVLIKLDGVPYDHVDRFVRERDARTGKSQLPWIEHIYYQQGARLENYYVRGMSLSGPAWSLLETGQHLQIKGNVEFDRYTLKTYDYLNFVPFVVLSARGERVDMAAVEVLDSLKTPLLSDAYAHDQSYSSFSLFQRGPRFITYKNSLLNKFKRPPKELFDEWTMGFELRSAIPDELIRELIENLANPRIRYLDICITDFDHVGHHNNDRESQLNVLKQLDSVLGRVWTAIQKSPLAEETAMVVVSDHGFNTDERIYSQGFNLVKLLGSEEGGGHHVITKRRLMLDYAIKGVNPFVPLITTTTPTSLYLKHQSTTYPTAVLDFDGNERASIHLRNSSLNALHILWQELQRKDPSSEIKTAAADAFFRILAERRPQWQKEIDDLNEELGALRRSIEQQQQLWAARPKQLSKEEVAAGKDDELKRIQVQLTRWQGQEKAYSGYAQAITNLLTLKREHFSATGHKVETLIPPLSMGEPNSVYDLQNYVVGLGPQGLVLKADKSLDFEKSFSRVNYFSLLHNQIVRNNVQKEVSNRPVDFLAVRLAAETVRPTLKDVDFDDVIWIFDGQEDEALILARRGIHGSLSFRYLPIRHLIQTAEGRVQFETLSWRPGLPLLIFEDKEFAIPESVRSTWLDNWHTDLEWLRALHKTQYSNGLIGLHEELANHPNEQLSLQESGISEDERLMRRFTMRQRKLIETDLLVMANNHWNFDVRGFNPGGNHGSFFRASTHSVFMVSGGARTGIPRAVVIAEPFDSLSFVPTMLALTGDLRDDSSPIPILWNKGFRPFPGRVVKDFLPHANIQPKIAESGAGTAP
jgi:hypothetical protein